MIFYIICSQSNHVIVHSIMVATKSKPSIHAIKMYKPILQSKTMNDILIRHFFGLISTDISRSYLCYVPAHRAKLDESWRLILDES